MGVRRQTVVGWLFVAPALAFYAVFVLQPMLLTLQYSLYRWDGVGPATWVGLANYLTVLRDPDGAISKKFGVDQLPSIVILDKQGNMSDGPIGGLDPNGNLATQLASRLDKLL